MVLPGRNPVRARQGAGHPRPAVGRTPAARLRPRRRRSARAAGVRRRAGRTGGLVRRGARRAARRCWTDEPSTTTATASTTTGCGCCPSRRSSRPTCGSAASRPASCAASAGSPTAGCRRSSRPPTPRRRERRSRQVAAEHGRAIDPEHYGVLIPYAMDALPEQLLAALATPPRRISPTRPSWCRWAGRRSPPRSRRSSPSAPPSSSSSPPVEPAAAPGWQGHLAEAADALLPLET